MSCHIHQNNAGQSACMSPGLLWHMRFNWSDGLMGWSPRILWALMHCVLEDSNVQSSSATETSKKSACKHQFTARQVDTNYPRSLTDSWWFLSPIVPLTAWLGQTTGVTEKVKGFNLQWVWVSTSKNVWTDETNGLMSCAVKYSAYSLNQWY